MFKTFFTKQFIRYVVIGILGTGLDFLFIYTFTQYVHLFYLISAIISIALVFPISFSLNKYWTFNNRGKNNFSQAVKYILTSSIAWVINLSVLAILVQFFGMWYILAKVFATIAGVAWNFLATKKWVFTASSKKN